MSRNYGLGSRDMDRAGCIAFDQMSHRGEISFATAAAYKSAWCDFATEAKKAGINRMECIERAFVIDYGRGLAEEVSIGDLAAGTAQGYITAINQMMAYVRARKWKSVSSTKECLIPERHFVREKAPLNRAQYEKFLLHAPDRYKALYLLCREFGLRSKEAALLDLRKALREAQAKGSLTVVKGTKGGRERVVPLSNSERQIKALEFAKGQLDKKDICLIPFDRNLAQYKHGEMREAREKLQRETGATGLHELRAAYACERYKELTGYDAPCIAGHREADRETDHAARYVIAEELGHGRIDVVAAYVGSSK